MSDIKKRLDAILTIARALKGPLAVKEFTRIAKELHIHQDFIVKQGLLEREELKAAEVLIRDIEFNGRRGQDFLHFANKLVKIMTTLETKIVENEKSITQQTQQSSKSRQYGWVQKTALGLLGFIGFSAGTADLPNKHVSFGARPAYSAEAGTANASVNPDMYQNVARRIERLNDEKKFNDALKEAQMYSDQVDNNNALFFNELGRAEEGLVLFQGRRRMRFHRKKRL